MEARQDNIINGKNIDGNRLSLIREEAQQNANEGKNFDAYRFSLVQDGETAFRVVWEPVQEIGDKSDIPSYEVKTSSYKCNACERHFTKASYLRQHTNIIHGEHRPFRCGICGKKFVTDELLQHHFRRHNSDKPYKCEFCPKQYNHKHDLKRHEFNHKEVKPYLCERCGKGFAREDHMRQHQLSH